MSPITASTAPHLRRCALMCLCLASILSIPCFAQSEDDGALRLRVTCRQATQMGSSKLMKAYTRKFGDEPSAMEAAMAHYNECKTTDNAERAKRLAAPARAQIENLYAALDSLVSVRFHLDGMGLGGDAKAFAMDELAARSELADTLSRIITDFEQPAPARPAAVTSFDERFALVKQKLAKNYGESPGDYIEEMRESDPELYEQQKNSYFEHYEEMLTRLAHVRSAAASLPPASAAQHVIRFVENFYEAP